MPDYRKLFPSTYLSGVDLLGQGEVRVVIREVRVEEVEEFTKKDGRKKSTKPVLYFYKTNKGMKLNRTNADMIAKHHGNDYDQWPGRAILLHSEKVDAYGETWDAVRVSDKVPQQPQPSQEEEAAPNLPAEEEEEEPEPEGDPVPEWTTAEATKAHETPAEPPAESAPSEEPPAQEDAPAAPKAPPDRTANDLFGEIVKLVKLHFPAPEQSERRREALQMASDKDKLYAYLLELEAEIKNMTN